MYDIQQANAIVAAELENTRAQIEAIYWHPSVAPIRQFINRWFMEMRSKIAVAPPLPTASMDEQFPPVTNFFGEKIGGTKSDKSDSPTPSPAMPSMSNESSTAPKAVPAFYVPLNRQQMPFRWLDASQVAIEKAKHEQSLYDEYGQLAELADERAIALILPHGKQALEPDHAHGEALGVSNMLKNNILTKNGEQGDRYGSVMSASYLNKYPDAYNFLWALKKRINAGENGQALAAELKLSV